MNPKRTVAGLAVIATAGIVIPLGTGATASAAETQPVIAKASPMAAAFGTAVRGTATQTKNSSRIDCDFGDVGGDIGDIGGYDASGDISGYSSTGDGTVADAGGGSATMSIAQAALAGAMAGAVGGAISSFANNAFESVDAAGEESAPSQSDSATAFD